MKRVYTSQDITLVHYLKGALEEQSIACLVKNADPAQVSLMERTPIVDWPELWVVDDRRADAARELIAAAAAPAHPEAAGWICPQCSEPIEAPFTQCWNCGQMQPAVQ